MNLIGVKKYPKMLSLNYWIETVKVEFLQSFEYDLKKIPDKSLKNKIKEIIILLQGSDKISVINKVKKIKGTSNAYRIRIGDYRLGFFYNDNIIELSRFVHRKDIYKLFP